MGSVKTQAVTDFILTRIAEDGTAAQPDIPWALGDGPYCVDCGDRAAGNYDPARVLAQCAAMRKIVDLHEISTERVWEHSWDGPAVQVEERSCAICGWVPTACDTLRALASIWSDHPDWREEWRP